MSSNTSPNNMANSWRCSEERVVQYRDVDVGDGNGTTPVGYRVLSLRQGHKAAQTPIDNEQGAAQEQGQKKKTAILVFHAMGADSNVIEFFAPFQENSSAPGKTTIKCSSTKQEDNSNFAAALSAGSGLGCPDGVLTNAHTSASKKPSNELVVIAVDRPGLGKTSPEVVNNPTLSADDTVKRHLNLHARNCLAVLQQEAPDELFVYACCLGHPYAVVFLRRFLQLQLESHQKQQPDLRGVALNVPYPSPAGPHGFGLARFASKYVPTSVLSGVACVGQGLCKPLVQFSFGNSSAKMLRTALSSEEKEMFIASVGSMSGSGSFGAKKYDFEQNGRVLDVMGLEGGKDTAKGLEVSTSLVWQDDCMLLAKELKGLADAFRQEGEEKKGKTSFFTVFGSSEKDRLTPAKAVRWLVTDVYAELGCDYEATAPCSSHELMLMGGGPVWKAPLHEKLLREKWALT